MPTCSPSSRAKRFRRQLDLRSFALTYPRMRGGAPSPQLLRAPPPRFDGCHPSQSLFPSPVHLKRGHDTTALIYRAVRVSGVPHTLAVLQGCGFFLDLQRFDLPLRSTPAFDRFIAPS